MNEYDLNKLLNDPALVDKNISAFLADKIIVKQDIDKNEIDGHIKKAEHNLRFVQENIKLKFYDWAVTGCYYASYHSALALILTKGYSSKSHIATLSVLIKEFYKKELNKEDLEIFSHFLDFQDVLFYVESKNKREEATYSTKTLFDKQEIESLRLKATMFVNKLSTLIKNSVK